MFDDPYIGMPIKLGNACHKCGDNMPTNRLELDNLPLAMSYVPFQKWTTTYPLEKALMRGTLFPDLDLPFKGGMDK